MPSTIRRSAGGKQLQALVDDLSVALMPHGSVQSLPLVVENKIVPTQNAHVVVIWDAWDGLPPTDRSKIILDAYAKTKRLGDAIITVAMGLGEEEALRMGFLPYSIVTTRRQGDNVSLAELSKALMGAGGILLKVGSSTQLRFPTRDQAEDAYRYLSQAIPGPYWAIVYEQGAVE
jgi:hypothetical protein